MNAKFKNFSTLVTLLLATVLSSASILAQQTQDRIIKYNSWRNEPIKITKVKIGDLPVEFGEKFQGENDWLRGLTFSVTNTSDKAVCYINIALDFPRAASQEPMTRDRLLWSCRKNVKDSAKSSEKVEPLKPGESIDIVLSNEAYQETQDFLSQTNYPASISLLEVSVDEVGFVGEKDTLWIAGQMMRRDSNNPNRWLPMREKQ